jgi:hypothetical protein
VSVRRGGDLLFISLYDVSWLCRCGQQVPQHIHCIPFPSTTSQRTSWRYFFFGRTGPFLFERKDGDEGEGLPTASLPVRHPHNAVQENGTDGATRQSCWLRTADGFAVCSSTNSRRSPDPCILTWIKDADCDPVVRIVGRVHKESAVAWRTKATRSGWPFLQQAAYSLQDQQKQA